MEKNQICRNCEYWREMSNLKGKCRYNPPKLFMVDTEFNSKKVQKFVAKYPETYEDDFCSKGKFTS